MNSQSSTPTSDFVGLTVALRIRPLTAEEKLKGSTQAVLKVDEKMVVLLDPGEKLDDVLRQKRSREKRFLFDVAFGPEISQKEVYAQTTQHLIDSVVNGYNATVFAYGATGAGKTFTMLGNEKNPGIMARTLNDLFIKMQSNKNDFNYDVKMSYLEIYNEMIRDLLQPSSEILDLREDSKGSVQVAGLSEIRASSTNDVLTLLMQGNTRRTQEPTLANRTSSRSHAVLQVTVTQTQKPRDINATKRTGRLFLIDLAGSERASQTQNTGQRFKEGAHINRSLLALGNVINTLAEKGAKFVNYRDSKLTRILKDSLGGNSRTVMIANVSPASHQFEESRNTLIYADRAKNITTKLTRNTQDVTYHVTQYQSIISELRKEIVRLKSKIDEQNGAPTSNLIRSESAQSFYVSPPKDNYMSNTISLPPIKQSHEFYSLRDEFIGLFQVQMKLRHQLMELNDKAYDLAFQIAKSEAELQSLNQHSDGTAAPVIQDKTHLMSDLENMKKRLADFEHKRNELEYDLSINRKDRKRLEDKMSATIGNVEQREIWSLLFRLHEVEVDKTVLQSDAMLLSRRLDRQESSFKKLTDFKNASDQVVTEQQKLITGDKKTGGGLTYTDRAKQLYQTYKFSKNKLEVAQKTRVAESYAKSSWNRDQVAKERPQLHPHSGKSFNKTMTSEELKKWKQTSLQRSDSTNSLDNLPSLKQKVRVQITRAPKDDHAVNYSNSGTSPTLEKIKSKANEKRASTTVGWKSPIDNNRPVSSSGTDNDRNKMAFNVLDGKKKESTKNRRSKSISLPSSRRNSNGDNGSDKPSNNENNNNAVKLPALKDNNASNANQNNGNGKSSKIPAVFRRPNPHRRLRSPTQSNLPHISY